MMSSATRPIRDALRPGSLLLPINVVKQLDFCFSNFTTILSFENHYVSLRGAVAPPSGQTVEQQTVFTMGRICLTSLHHLELKMDVYDDIS